MTGAHEEYLVLLDGVGQSLERLTQLSGEKIQAVQNDDLIALDEVMKQEQAISLNLRGVENRRVQLLGQLGLEGVSLSDLPGRYPAQMRTRAAQTAQDLHSRYETYRAAAQKARGALEATLRELERIIAAQGGGQSGGAGYVPADVQPPDNMKTDFRA